MGHLKRRTWLACLLTVASVLSGSTTATVAAADASQDQRGLVVATDKGVVRGMLKDGVREFLGIPYAAPPVGDLRWQPAQAHARWLGVRDATAFGSPCPQPAEPGPGSTNEDCLFLNVYTPPNAGPQDRYPVMFWIHGGSLTSGDASQYDPIELVARGVVVVTINYRLGALGFLAQQSLAASVGGPSGDYGLTDQQQALRWSQGNISGFGGDPQNLTIFGESAGGLSVHSQLASPLAHGLFTKAITESGAYSLVQPSLTQAEASGALYSTSVGCPNQTAACLRSVPVSTLLANQAGGYVPNVDGHVLTQSIGPALESGEFNRVPVMEGTNHDEFRFFVAIAELSRGQPLTAAGYEAAIQQTIGAPASAAHILATVFYPLSSYGGNPSIALGALGTDAVFACSARRSLRFMSAFVPTRQYEFTDDNAPTPFSVSFPMGAFHGSELQYLFGPIGGVVTSPLSPDQQRLSAAMISYWTQFAKTGDPNSPKTSFWPAYTTASEPFQSLVPPSPATSSGFAAEHQCALWGG
ncbi:MAG: carboxylesterase family protein [Acidimicrobiaceae bacterium]|nr:carboxylesterase family protein [Acidimicrobiaceae bacterium]